MWAHANHPTNNNTNTTSSSMTTGLNTRPSLLCVMGRRRANVRTSNGPFKKNNRPPPVQPLTTRPIDRTPQRPFDPNRARACCLRRLRGRAGCSLGFGIPGRRSASVEMIEALKRSLQRKAVLPRCAERFTFDHMAFSSAWPPSVIAFALHLRPKAAFNGSIDSVGS